MGLSCNFSLKPIHWLYVEHVSWFLQPYKDHIDSESVSFHLVISCESVIPCRHIVSHCVTLLHVFILIQYVKYMELVRLTILLSLCELYWWAWISCQPMARCIHSKLQNLRHGCIYNPFSTHRISWSSSPLKAWYDNRSTIRRHAAMISQYSHWQPLACKCWNVQLSISCGLPGKKFRLVDSKWRQALCGPVSRISMDIYGYLRCRQYMWDILIHVIFRSDMFRRKLWADYSWH